MWERLSIPFRTKPTSPKSGYTKSHLEKGEQYHKNFSDRPGTKMIWELEKAILQREIARLPQPVNHLDFASGTGRVLTALRKSVHKQCALDVSKRMLDVAAQNVPDVAFICADFRDDPGILARQFDLITAFRFFPNAEAELRDDAMSFLRSHLKSERARLICNNHRNFWSVPYIAGRAIGSPFCAGGMTHREMLHLATRNGLEVERTYSIGIVPQSGTVSVLPWRQTARLEQFLLRTCGSRHRLGYDVLYVLKPSA